MCGRKIIYSLVMLMTIAAMSCRFGIGGQTKSDALSPSTQNRMELISIANSIGVIILNDKRQGNSKDVIRLFNDDGGLWYEFSFYDESDIKFNGSNADFSPFAFHQDYFLLVFIGRCKHCTQKAKR